MHNRTSCSRVQYNCILSGHGTLLWNRTRCQRNEKINNSNNTQSSSSAIYAYKTNFSVAQTTRQSSSYIFLRWKKRGNVTKHTHHHPGLEPRITRSEWQRPTCSPPEVRTWQIIRLICIYIRTNRYLEKVDKKTKTSPAAGRRHKHGLGRYLLGREGRARWGTSSNQRTERWSSSRSRAFTVRNLV